jgi:hypothetical protein
VKSKAWAILLAVLFAVFLGTGLILLQPGETAHRVEIQSEGKVLYTLDLHVDQQITVTTDRGSNTVTIRDGKVSVTEASCPDHYCMQRGWCDGGAEIVCLPNRLVIRFLGEQKIDGVSG